MSKSGEKKAPTMNRARQRADEYANASEFCKLFNNDMPALYSLSLALTADHAKAEQCFMAAFEECRKATGVFKQWERSWSRLAIIENAIRILRPAIVNVAGISAREGEVPAGIHSEIAPVMRLNAFHRFVYVLSVLDHYSARDCAVLLKCAWQEVARARRRAMEFVAAAGSQVVSPAWALGENRLTA